MVMLKTARDLSETGNGRHIQKGRTNTSWSGSQQLGAPDTPVRP